MDDKLKQIMIENNSLPYLLKTLMVDSFFILSEPPVILSSSHQSMCKFLFVSLLVDFKP